MTPTDPLEAAWEDMLSELRFGDDTEVAYVEEVVAKHRPLIEAATPRPAGVDVERLERALLAADKYGGYGWPSAEEHARAIAFEYAALEDKS